MKECLVKFEGGGRVWGSVLPLYLERLAKRLEDHVVHTCATCRAGGTPCGAGPTCGKGNLIFPFQVRPLCRGGKHRFGICEAK